MNFPYIFPANHYPTTFWFNEKTCVIYILLPDMIMQAMC